MQDQISYHWSNAESNTLIELYKNKGNNIIWLSNQMSKHFPKESTKFTSERVKNQLLSLLEAGVLIFRALIEERQDQYIEIPRQLRIKPPEELAVNLLQSDDKIFLVEKINLLKLEYQTRLKTKQIKTFLNLIVKSCSQTKRSMTLSTQSNQSTRTNKIDFVSLLEKYGNDFDTVRSLLNVSTVKFLRINAVKLFRKSLIKLRQYVKLYFNPQFPKLNSQLRSQVSHALVSPDLKYDQNMQQMRSFCLVILRAMANNEQVSPKFTYIAFKQYAWVTEKISQIPKKPPAQPYFHRWSQQELNYLSEIYEKSESFSQLSRSMTQKFGQQVKFNGRKIETVLIYLIRYGIEELISLMIERRDEFTQFFRGSANRLFASRVLRSPEVDFSVKGLLVKLKKTQQNIPKDLICKTVTIINQLYKKLASKQQTQRVIQQKISGIHMQKNEKQFNLIDDGIEICSDKNGDDDQIRTYFSWSQSQEKALYELFKSQQGNRFTNLSKQMIKKFPNERKSKYNVGKIDSKLTSLIRNGVQTLKRIGSGLGISAPQTFLQGKNYEKSSKILKLKDPESIRLRNSLLKLFFYKKLEGDEMSELVLSMASFQQKFNEMELRKKVKIQVTDDKSRQQNSESKSQIIQCNPKEQGSQFEVKLEQEKPNVE